MSMNHFSSSSSSSSELNLPPPPPPTHWWPPQPQHLNNNFMEDTTSWLNPYSHPAPPPPPAAAGPEHLFEKPLTPSDVGKLNRLVIPKQHAERYFPLGGESGLVLGFEDESGKAWKFRYSYWNSSQSYVLTKGWSRYVKEKQLDAGDVVLFQRLDGRLFIGWRRRGDSNNCTGVSGNNNSVVMRSSTASTGGISCSSSSFASNNNNEFPRPGTMAQGQSTSIGNPKRLRLFGVNLECHVYDHSSEPSTPDGSSMSSQGLTHHHNQFYNTQSAYSYSSSSPSHMDGISYANQIRNRRG